MSDALNALLYGIVPDADEAGAIAKKLAGYAADADAIQARIDAREEETKADAVVLRTLLEQTIPDFMKEAGVKEFKLSDGTKVEVKPYVRARLVPEHAAAGLAWLEANGYAGIIKHEVAVAFGRDPGPEYQSTLDALAEVGVRYTDTETVHPQTLTAMCRELIARGEVVPVEPFGLFTGEVAKVTRPKR